MLKVLHLFDEYLPPSQIWAYHLLSNLKEVEVHIGAQYFWKNNFYPDHFTFTDQLNINLDQYATWGKRRLLVRAWLKLNQLFWTRSKLPIAYLLNYLKRNQIDLIHTHFGPVGCEFMELAKRSGLPYIVSFYGYDYQKLPTINPSYRTRYQQLFQQADLVLSEGPTAKQQLLQLGVPDSKAALAPLGVVLDQIPFIARKKQVFSLRLIQVASFTEKKGHLYSVQAFAEAIKTCPNMKLDLIGADRDGLSLQRVREFIESRDLGKHIRILDFVSFQELPSHLEGSDVFIHPSCVAQDGDTEGGAPVILLEAQASGLPIISTQHCDIPNVVADGNSGVLVPERNIEALVKAIKFFYAMDEQEYQLMSKKARRFISHNYDIRDSAQTLHQYYLKLAMH